MAEKNQTVQNREREMTNVPIPAGFTFDVEGKLWLSGNQFYLDAWELARKLQSSKHFDEVYCVARGGYALGSVVGNCFSRNNVKVVHVKSYAGEKSGTVEIETIFPEEIIQNGGRGVLILDEMVDSGKSAKKILETLPHAHFAVVYAKEESKGLASTFLKIVPSNIWIVFPWEKEPSKFIPQQ